METRELSMGVGLVADACVRALLGCVRCQAGAVPHSVSYELRGTAARPATVTDAAKHDPRS